MPWNSHPRRYSDYTYPRVLTTNNTVVIKYPNSTKTNKMDRDSLVYKAKLAEQAERFDEMVQDM